MDMSRTRIFHIESEVSDIMRQDTTPTSKYPCVMVKEMIIHQHETNTKHVFMSSHPQPSPQQHSTNRIPPKPDSINHDPSPIAPEIHASQTELNPINRSNKNK